MNQKKILIIKLAAIGDVVMATPAFAAIRRHDPEAHITLLVGAWAAPVVEYNPAFSEIIIVDENIFWKKRLGPLMKLLFRLRSEHFDTAYIMHWSGFFNLFALLIGARERIGFSRGARSRFLTRAVPFTEGEKGTHVVDRYLAMTPVKPNDSGGVQMQVFLSKAEISEMQAYVRAHVGGLSNTIIALAPGGGSNPRSQMPIRCWPEENFIALGKRILSEPGRHIILIGGPSEVVLGERIHAALGAQRCMNTVGTLSLRQTAALLQQCSVLVANDSAPMHLAAAVGTSTVSLFGPTAPYDKAPRGGKHHFLYHAQMCSPCYRYGEFPDCRKRKCMKHITVDEVMAAVHAADDDAHVEEYYGTGK